MPESGAHDGAASAPAGEKPARIMPRDAKGPARPHETVGTDGAGKDLAFSKRYAISSSNAFKAASTAWRRTEARSPSK